MEEVKVDMLEAVILAGGFGTRLQSVVSDVPKPMAPVAGRPFLCYLLESLLRQGYTRAVLATGYLHEKVEACFGSDYRGLALAYSRETSPLGTGGAIVGALQHCHSDSVTVLNGDTLLLADLAELRQLALQKATPLAVVLRAVDDAGRYGAVDTDADGRITSFHEKDPAHGPGLINGGIYQLHRSLLAGRTVGEPFSFEREVLQGRFREEAFYGYRTDGYFIDIGVPDDYRRAQTELPLL